MANEGDIVQRLFALLHQHGHPVPTDKQVAAEQQLRQEFGGERVYIKRAPSRIKSQRLASALQSGVSIREAIRRADLGRSQGFALLGRKAKAAR